MKQFDAIIQTTLMALALGAAIYGVAVLGIAIQAMRII